MSGRRQNGEKKTATEDGDRENESGLGLQFAVSWDVGDLSPWRNGNGTKKDQII